MPSFPSKLLSARSQLVPLLTAAIALVVSMLGLPHPAQASRVPTLTAPSKACTAPKLPAFDKTRFGVTLNPSPTLADDKRAEEKRFGKLRVVRVYDPSIPPDNAWERRKPQLRGAAVATSFRMPPQEVLAGKYDGQLRHFFRTAPRRKTIYWTYYHEPEPAIDQGLFSARQYRRAWRHIALIAGGFCKPRLFPTLILTGWTAESASGRSLATYFPGRSYVSLLAWDPYNQAVGTPSSYRPAADVFSAVVKVARRAHLPWAVTETGTARVSGDSGSGRAAWIKSMGRYLRKHHARFVTYFQSTYRGDFELRDKPSIRAYRPFVQS